MQIFDLLNINTNMTPTPSSFNNGLSLYEDISKLLYLVNQMITNVNGNTNETNSLLLKYQTIQNELTSIKGEFEKYTEGEFIPNGSIDFTKFNGNVLEKLGKFVEDYMYNLHHFVTFGIENDHFVAYIPETWKEINFSTDIDGQLVLEF